MRFFSGSFLGFLFNGVLKGFIKIYEFLEGSEGLIMVVEASFSKGLGFEIRAWSEL